MGGDGGVIASNRKYMRGAGTADHTADQQRHAEKTNEKQIPIELMSTCYLTKTPLQFIDNSSGAIVACPYGRLYHKEAAVEALLRRKQQEQVDELGKHIRGLKDLMSVRFQLSSSTDNDNKRRPICPVTGLELNGQHACFLIYNRKQTDGPNVISERAVKEMGLAALQADFGSFDENDLIRLAPPPSLLESTIVEQVRVKQEAQAAAKKSKSKDDKKRKHKQQNGGSHKQPKKGAAAPISSKPSKTSVANAARQRVETAVKSNEVLSSLFSTSEHAKQVTEKDKKDALFAR